ncbi:MAG: D-alanine--D-alanine ligase [Vampirovibrionales bacterium]|nr:D-alanine--D-alanine ligase [Vampirovibrionales bacterium]
MQTPSTPPSNLRIGVLCGGASAERAVSLRSGKAVHEALLALGYTHSQLLDIQPGPQLLDILQSAQLDVAFLALHGTLGEDGAIQGLLDWLKIPYTGNSLAACALSMNKSLTKKVLRANVLPVLDDTTLACPYDPAAQAQALQAESNLTLPLMIKPAAQGSSVGASKVSQWHELPEALAKAQKAALDVPTPQTLAQVVLEPFVSGVDATVGVLMQNEQLVATPVLMLKPKNEAWYNEVAKYTEGETEFLLPAPLSATLTAALQHAAIQTHLALGCSGVSRTDFILPDANSSQPHSAPFYILELNAIPGMTTLSDLPAQAKAMGIDFNQLVQLLLNTAPYAGRAILV